jgi:hypothetical protein
LTRRRPAGRILRPATSKGIPLGTFMVRIRGRETIALTSERTPN